MIEAKRSNYHSRFLNEGNLAELLCLQNIIVKNLPDPAIYHAGSLEFIKHQLTIDKSVLGIFKDTQLVGFNIFELPGDNTIHLGEDIGLTRKELAKTVEFGPVGIHPAHRNNGLLGMILEKHLEVVKEKGYEHVCLTIAPSNYPSLKRTLSYGFTIKKLTYKYNGLLRYILHLNLKRPYTKPQYIIKIASTDIETQDYMIGLGFCGYGLSINRNKIDVSFGIHKKIALL